MMGSAKKIIIPIVFAVLVLIVVGIPFGVYIAKSDGQPGGIKTKVSSSDKTYTQAYDNVKAYDEYQEEQSQIMYDSDVDYTEEDSGASSQTDFIDTNVRTEGVAEPDDVKTDGEYIYMTDTDGRRLTIYHVEDGEIKSMGANRILEEDYYFNDLYISGDTLIVMGTKVNEKEGYGRSDNTFTFGYNPYNETFINFYDVSDREHPELVKTLLQDGVYASSRVMDGELYTFSSKWIDLKNYKKSDVGSYIPSVDGDILLPEDIILYEKTNASYLVATAINTAEMKYISKKAVMGGSSDPYVSENAIYTQINCWEEHEDSTLIKIDLGNGNLEFKCDGTYKGSLLNDYSIDEYKGYVRLVTSYRNDSGELRNGLYVLDENLESITTIKALAPDETVKSARFMGDIVYFVTYKVVEQFWDPLFAVDLSDPENPEITDYVELPGFSGYLHPYGENKLLGIGYDTNEATGRELNIKFTMFDTTDPFNIKEECTCNFRKCQDAEVLQDRKSFMYNPEDGTFGFGVFYTEPHVESDEDANEGPILSETAAPLERSGIAYMVFDYDEELGFIIRQNIDLGKDANGIDEKKARGIVIGDYFYLANSHKGLSAYDTTNYELVY